MIANPSLSLSGQAIDTAQITPALVAETDAAGDAVLTAKLNVTMLEMAEMKAATKAGFAHDMMLERGKAKGEAQIMGAVNALVDQTRSIEQAVTALGVAEVAFEGADGLDDPEAVLQ